MSVWVPVRREVYLMNPVKKLWVQSKLRIVCDRKVCVVVMVVIVSYLLYLAGYLKSEEENVRC